MAAWAQQSGLANAALLAAFGSPVSYQPAVGESFTVTGIVDQTSEEERQANGVYVRLFVQLANFTLPPASAGTGMMRGPSRLRRPPHSSWGEA